MLAVFETSGRQSKVTLNWCEGLASSSLYTERKLELMIVPWEKARLYSTEPVTHTSGRCAQG